MRCNRECPNGCPNFPTREAHEPSTSIGNEVELTSHRLIHDPGCRGRHRVLDVYYHERDGWVVHIQCRDCGLVRRKLSVCYVQVLDRNAGSKRDTPLCGKSEDQKPCCCPCCTGPVCASTCRQTDFYCQCEECCPRSLDALIEIYGLEAVRSAYWESWSGKMKKGNKWSVRLYKAGIYMQRDISHPWQSPIWSSCHDTKQAILKGVKYRVNPAYKTPAILGCCCCCPCPRRCK